MTWKFYLKKGDFNLILCIYMFSFPCGCSTSWDISHPGCGGDMYATKQITHHVNFQAELPGGTVCVVWALPCSKCHQGSFPSLIGMSLKVLMVQTWKEISCGAPEPARCTQECRACLTWPLGWESSPFPWASLFCESSAASLCSPEMTISLNNYIVGIGLN